MSVGTMAQTCNPKGAGGNQPPVSHLIQQFAGPCKSLASHEMRVLAKLCETGKQFMLNKARQLISAAAGAPVLISYSSDGTPVSTRKRATAKSSSNVSIMRTGKTTEEFLVQHAFVRYLDARGVAHSTVVLQDPLPMTNGKSAWALLACAIDFLPTARKMGHSGISICHYAFDRMAYSALVRHLKGYHEELAASASSQHSASSAPTLLQLTEWVVGAPCGLHDTHNSLKWSLHAKWSSTDLMGDCFIIIESLRNSADLLHKYMGGWIQDRVRFVPEESLPSPQHLYELWTCLGVEQEAVEVLSTTLRLQWAGDCLEVTEAAADMDNLVGQISFALLSVWSLAIQGVLQFQMGVGWLQLPLFSGVIVDWPGIPSCKDPSRPSHFRL